MTSYVDVDDLLRRHEKLQRFIDQVAFHLNVHMHHENAVVDLHNIARIVHHASSMWGFPEGMRPEPARFASSTPPEDDNRVMQWLTDDERALFTGPVKDLCRELARTRDYAYRMFIIAHGLAIRRTFSHEGRSHPIVEELVDRMAKMPMPMSMRPYNDGVNNDVIMHDWPGMRSAYAPLVHEEPSRTALQLMMDRMKRRPENECEQCGGSGVFGQAWCEQCGGTGEQS
jgi:hypothetical protein